MAQAQSQGLGGLSLRSTADLSGTLTDVTGGNSVGTTYKNAVGLAAIYGAAAYFAVAGSNAAIIGVICDTPVAGQSGNIQSVRGTSAKVLTGAAVTVGDNLITDSNGAFITATGAAQKVCGIALQTASGAAQLIEAVLVDGYVA